MFPFFGKLFLLVGFGSAIGYVAGMLVGSPEIGVVAFLIFAVSFRKTVFETLPKE